MKKLSLVIACCLFALVGCGGSSSPAPAPVGDSFTNTGLGLVSTASEDESAIDISLFAESLPEDSTPVDPPA